MGYRRLFPIFLAATLLVSGCTQSPTPAATPLPAAATHAPQAAATSTPSPTPTRGQEEDPARASPSPTPKSPTLSPKGSAASLGEKVVIPYQDTKLQVSIERVRRDQCITAGSCVGLYLITRNIGEKKIDLVFKVILLDDLGNQGRMEAGDPGYPLLPLDLYPNAEKKGYVYAGANSSAKKFKAVIDFSSWGRQSTFESDKKYQAVFDFQFAEEQ